MEMVIGLFILFLLAVGIIGIWAYYENEYTPSLKGYEGVIYIVTPRHYIIIVSRNGISGEYLAFPEDPTKEYKIGDKVKVIKHVGGRYYFR